MSRLKGAGESRFGDLLLSQSLLNQHELCVAVDHAEHQQIPLADAVVTLGLVSEDRSYATLAGATGTRLVDLADTAPSPLALRLVPVRVARRHVLLPLDEDNRVLTYAVSRPFDDEAERDVRCVSGRRPSAVLARRSHLVSALDRSYPKMRDTDLLLGRVRSTASIEMIDCGSVPMTTDSPIIDLCNHIIARAVEAGASDVLIEPAGQALAVRYRLSGILEPVFTLPPEAALAARNRYKVMARVDMAVRHRPQDGAFRLRINGRPIDVRFSTLPAINGETLVLRVIDSQATPRDLASRVDRVLAPDAVVTVTTSDKGRVLVTDDDRITRMLIKLLIEKEGYEVIEAGNGRQAVDAARCERPDLLIIDLVMPEMDGYQAIERIRRDVSLATLPVLVLTAEDGPAIEHRVLEIGADDYMIKPFEPAVLLSRVRAALRRVDRPSSCVAA